VPEVAGHIRLPFAGRGYAEHRPLAGRFRRLAETLCSNWALGVACSARRARLGASLWSAAALTPLWLGHGGARVVCGAVGRAGVSEDV